MAQLSFSLSSHDLLTLFLVVFVAGFAWCAGCWTWGLIASGFAALRGRSSPPAVTPKS